MPDTAPEATGTDMVPAGARAFTFGEPESVLDRRELFQYFEIWHNSRWYEPPIPMDRLAQVFNMASHHRSALGLKVNLLLTRQRPSRWLKKDSFHRFALDFVQMGNGYLERVPNLAGNVARLQHTPARHTRRGLEDGVFWFIQNGGRYKEHRFDPFTVFQLQQPDVAQEIYGLPEWLAALQSALLNENATLFRRRYYLNGAHAGFVFYVSESLFKPEDVDELEEQFKQAKGVGNFKNMLLYMPGGKKDGVQIMPIADVAAKDEFQNVKNISRDDMLAAHRTPPQLIGIIPTNNGGFGKVGEALDAFFEIEIVPIMQRMLEVNDWLGLPALEFSPYPTSDGRLIWPDGEITDAGADQRRG